MKMLPGVVHFCIGLAICWIAAFPVESSAIERLVHLGLGALNLQVALTNISEAIRR